MIFYAINVSVYVWCVFISHRRREQKREEEKKQKEISIGLKTIHTMNRCNTMGLVPDHDRMRQLKMDFNENFMI